MSYQLYTKMIIRWVGDGTQNATQGPTGQAFEQETITAVPGGASATTANISTACTTAATATAALLNANYGTIQAWATGGN
jgi:hypothetical protein